MAYIGKTPSQAVRSRYFYTATGGETSLSGADDNGDTLIFADGNYVDVYLNGVLLVASSDYNVNTVNTIAGLTALTASDIVEIVVYDTFSVFGGVFQGDLSADTITGDMFGSHQFEAKNIEGSTIPKGTPVYIAGHSGNDPEIAIADADDPAKMPAFGITTAAIANNNKGDVIVFGNYIGIDTSSFSVGDELYVSNTGTLVNTRPTASADKVQKIAKVIRSQSQNGQIFVMGAGRSNDVPNTITTNSINLGSTTTVSSVLDEDTMTSDSATALATQQSIKAYVDSQIGSNNELSEILTNGNTTGGNDISFGDNDKAIFGAGSDLQIYHDGVHSTIKDAGSGSLFLQSSNNIYIQNANGSANYFKGTDGGASELFHNGSTKLATTATGVDAINTTGSSTSRFGSTYNTGANDGTLVIGNGGSGDAMLRFDYEGTNTDRARIGVTSSGQQLEFYTAGNNERMRIDSSGNLLVGKTAVSTSTAGFEVRSDGLIYSGRNGNEPLILNRLTSDGTIADFRKDGSTVGSIGTNENTDLYIAGGDTGLLLNDDADFICPATATGSGRDNAIDLGYSTVRFKNLYLSGGVFLGGVGSANYLDDYEEGTWTPTIVAGATSISVAQAKYTKVGRLVTAQLYATGISGTSAGGLSVSLPFSVDGYYTALNDPNFGNHQEVRTEHGTSYVNLFEIDGSRTQTTGNSYGTSRHMIWSITYTTT